MWSTALQGRRAARFAARTRTQPENFPRNMFVWRSNLLGSSGKGHEYFLKYLLGTDHGVQGKDLGAEGGAKPEEVRWRDKAPEGKLDLLVTLDFRMSTTCLYSDIVLPTATWYEKNDLNTSRHASVHPSAVGGGGSGVGIAQRLGDLQGHRQEVLRSLRRPSRRGTRRGADADHARHAGRTGAAVRRAGLEAAANASSIPGKTVPHDGGGRARLPERSTNASPRSAR